MPTSVGAKGVPCVPPAIAQNTPPTFARPPAVSLRVQGVTSNTVPAVPYRGAGRPEAHHVIERLLDLAARRLKMDRAEIRRRNLVRKCDLPYRTPMRLLFESGDFAGYMERALEIADYAGFAERKRMARRRRGLGMANYVESPVGAPRERIELRVTRGAIEIIAGTQSSGQGHETAFAQVAADQLEMPIEKIRLRTGDTAFVKSGGGTHSDRSLRFVSTLLVAAGRQLLEKGRQAAAAKMEVAAADVVYQQGSFRVAGTDRAIALLDLAELAVEEDFNGRIPAHP